MQTYKALVPSNMAVYFKANCNTEAKAVARRIGATKLIRKLSPTSLEFIDYA